MFVPLPKYSRGGLSTFVETPAKMSHLQNVQEQHPWHKNLIPVIRLNPSYEYKKHARRMQEYIIPVTGIHFLSKG